MYENPESQDKNVRDIIEGPPRMESAKAFESTEKKTESLVSGNEKVESQPTKPAPIVTQETAHRVALSLLPNQEFIKQLKEMIKEKLVRGEAITRLDVAIAGREAPKEPYGLSKEHLVEKLDKNFLTFDLVRDGDDLVISFQKTTGDAAVRSLDNKALAEMLNQLLTLKPNLMSDLNLEKEKARLR